MVMPLELKTGRKSDMALMKYRAQVILYCAMLISKFPDQTNVVGGCGGVLLFLDQLNKSQPREPRMCSTSRETKNCGYSQEIVPIVSSEVRGTLITVICFDLLIHAWFRKEQISTALYLHRKRNSHKTCFCLSFPSPPPIILLLIIIIIIIKQQTSNQRHHPSTQRFSCGISCI